MIKGASRISAERLNGIVVTPAMIEEGLAEMSEHPYNGDTTYMLESVFRAMAYASPLASSMRDSK